jgi:SAM-dependent methyltransferase
MTAPVMHPMMPRATQDEFARCEFVQSLKYHVATDIRPGNKAIYDKRAAPSFAKKEGRQPANRHEVRRLMAKDEGWQMWGALQRTSQEMLWDTVGEPIERDLTRMIGESKARDRRAKGSLRLDPAFVAPRYIKDVDVHVMPGGYCTDLTADDVTAGAYYDFGVYWFTMSALGRYNDEKGRRLIRYLRHDYPGLKPKRILDLGCSVAHSTLPFVDAFPGAEVHAIDVGAPMLRYAHARAEALGKPIHFAQENAEKTDYPDGFFDLVVSHILLHEVSRKALGNIMKECHRLLAPGGVTAHQDVTLFQGMTPYEAFDADWDTYNNNEPCWAQMRDVDAVALMSGAGFAKAKVQQAWTPHGQENVYSRTPVAAATYVLSAQK